MTPLPFGLSRRQATPADGGAMTSPTASSTSARAGQPASGSRSVVASGSVLRGTGEPPRQGGGGGAPSVGGLLKLALGASLDRAAEEAWRTATREQLLEVARRMAAIDSEKALAASALLAWAVAGSEPVVPTVEPGSLSWVFLASRAQLRALGEEIVHLSPEAARSLYVGLHEALEAEEKAFQASLRTG